MADGIVNIEAYLPCVWPDNQPQCHCTPCLVRSVINDQRAEIERLRVLVIALQADRQAGAWNEASRG